MSERTPLPGQPLSYLACACAKHAHHTASPLWSTYLPHDCGLYLADGSTLDAWRRHIRVSTGRHLYLKPGADGHAVSVGYRTGRAWRMRCFLVHILFSCARCNASAAGRQSWTLFRNKSVPVNRGGGGWLSANGGVFGAVTAHRAWRLFAASRAATSSLDGFKINGARDNGVKKRQ